MPLFNKAKCHLNFKICKIELLHFQALTKEEKEPYMNEAKREKECRQYNSRPDAMDCTGQYISVGFLVKSLVLIK